MLGACQLPDKGQAEAAPQSPPRTGQADLVSLVPARDEVPQQPYYRVSEQPRLQIGSVDGGDSGLYLVADALRLRDGCILVANRGSGEIKFFDEGGSFLTSVGREGEGPGEFKSLHKVAELEDGRIAALDLMLGRVTVFSATGQLERTFSVFSALGGGPTHLDVYGFLPDGRLVGLREVEGEGTEIRFGDYPSDAVTFRAPVMQPVLIDTAGRAVPFGRPIPGDEAVSQMEMGIDGAGDMVLGGIPFVQLPFLKTVEVAVVGSAIALGHTSDYNVRLYDAQGKPRGFFGGDVPKDAPPGVRRAWADEWVESIANPGQRRRLRNRYEALLSSASAPATLPAFKSIVLQRNGNVWVETYDPSLEEDDPSNWEVQGTGDVSDRGFVSLPPRFRPLDIGSNEVLGVWRNELGIEFVRVYDLIAPDSDAP